MAGGLGLAGPGFGYLVGCNVKTDAGNADLSGWQADRQLLGEGRHLGANLLFTERNAFRENLPILPLKYLPLVPWVDVPVGAAQIVSHPRRFQDEAIQRGVAIDKFQVFILDEYRIGQGIQECLHQLSDVVDER